MLVGTLTNILVKKFLGRKFIPRFAKYLIKFPDYIVVAVLVVVSCMPVTTNRSSARKPVPSYAPPPPTEEGVNWRGGYCALLPLPQLLFYHYFYKYLLSPFGPLATKSKSAIASR